MRHNSFLARVVSFSPLLIMMTYPLFCAYDFSKSTFYYYDFLAMNGNILWFVMVIVAVSLLGAWKRGDLPLPSLFAIAILFSVAEVSTNYPMIWRDVFLHGSAVNGIMQKGYITTMYWAYPETHPGFFLLWSAVSLVTALDLFQSNLLVLLPVGVILLLLLLLVIYQRLSVTPRNTATLLTFLLMNFNLNEYMFVHFNTRLLPLIYVLVLLLLFLRGTREMNTLHDRPSIVLILITNFALVISHVLNSLVPIVFFAIYWLVSSKASRTRSALFMSCAMVYVTWNMYVGYNLLVEGVRTVLRYLYITLALDIVSGWSPLQARSEPLFGSILLNYEKALLVTLTLASLYCTVRLWKQVRIKVLGCYLFSVLAVFGVSFFSVLTWISAHRAIIFASLAIAALPVILLTHSKSMNWKRRMLVATVIVMVIPHFILVHEPSLARSTDIGSIPDIARFLVKYRGGQQIVSVGDFPTYYCFYEPFYQGYDNLQIETPKSLQNVTDFISTSPEASLKIMDYRAIVDWSTYLGRALSYEDGRKQWNAEVYMKLNSYSNIVYANGLETIYN